MKWICKHLNKRYPLHSQNSADKHSYHQLKSTLETSTSSSFFTSQKNIGLEWIIRLHLAVNKMQSTKTNLITDCFKQIQRTHNNYNHHQIPGQVREILKKHPGSVWLKIDHNARQYARVCPLRFHHILMKTFLQDTKQYKVITNTENPNKPSLNPETTSKFIRKHLNSR